jgi:ATP synthase protein I
MSANAEPERELIRRAAPLAVPAAALALVVGAIAGGWPVGWSAALGVTVVALNFVASGLSISWAAGISLTAIAVVVMGGFVVRMAAILAIMFALDRLTAWFVPLAFGLAVVPATMLLLIYELKLMAGGLGRDLILPVERGA